MRLLFENSVLDVARRELWRDDSLIPLEPQVFDLLAFLVRHRDRVVSKEDVFAAVWNGRVVSEAVLTTRLNAARSAVGDSGKAQRVIRTHRGRGMRFVAAVREQPWQDCASVGTSQDADPLPAAPPDQPSLAVLPFANLSGNPGYDYLVDGIVEEITTALAKWRWFLVIDRNTTFTYKHRNVDARLIGTELGVRYVLGGSVRLSEGSVRISAQLIEAATATHVWADRFDSALGGVFAVQDGLADAVVAALEPQLRSAELRRIRQKRPQDLNAYDYQLQALWHVHTLNEKGAANALRLLERGLALEPSYAAAAALASYCYRFRRQQGWSSSPDEDAIGMQFAERALDCNPEDPFVLWAAGHAITALGQDHVRARGLIDRSLALNANCAEAWAVSGWNHDHMSDRSAALADFQRALRLSPLDPMNYFVLAGISCAYMNLHRYEEAVAFGWKSIRHKGSFGTAWRAVAVSLAYLGRRKEALAAVQRLREVDPSITVAMVDGARCNLADRHERQHYLDGLRLAGLPER